MSTRRETHIQKASRPRQQKFLHAVLDNRFHVLRRDKPVKLRLSTSLSHVSLRLERTKHAVIVYREGSSVLTCRDSSATLTVTPAHSTITLPLRPSPLQPIAAGNSATTAPSEGKSVKIISASTTAVAADFARPNDAVDFVTWSVHVASSQEQCSSLNDSATFVEPSGVSVDIWAKHVVHCTSPPMCFQSPPPET